MRGASGRRAACLLSAWLPLLGAARPVRGQGPAPRIESIEVRRDNVFSLEEAAAAFFPYRLANALHWKTREAFIRKELLFAIGDPVDPAILAETERNLRAFKLFRRARIQERDGAVTVETGDAWTLIPRFNLSRKGAETEYGFGLEEMNVAGTGKSIAFRYDRDVDRVSRSFAYFDPQAIWPHTFFQASASDLSDGQALELGAGRPFYALDAPWTAGTFYRQARYDTKLYAAGDVTTNWKKRVRIFRIDGGSLFSRGAARADRFLGGVDYQETLLEENNMGPPPPPDGSARTYLYSWCCFSREGSGWIERAQVEEIGRDEDFNLAASGQVDVGVSPPVFNAGTALRVRAAGSVGTLVPHGFSLATVAFVSRLQAGPQATRLDVGLRLYRLWPKVTLAARMGVRAGWRLDPEDQIYLDGATGVRGYRLFAVAGTGNATANIEARVVVFPDILKLIALGFAAFADSGISWGPPDGSWRLADVGVGLRIGLARASKNTILRLDVARALRPDPQGRTGWLVSFSSGQAF